MQVYRPAEAAGRRAHQNAVASSSRAWCGRARLHADRGLYRHACVLARSYVYRVRYTGPGPAIQVVTTTLHLFLKKFRLPAVLLQNLGPCIFF